MALPSELRLKKLEEDIKALRLDVNDDATNYTRSKHEIKEMKRKLSNQEAQAKKLRSQVAKHKAKHVEKEGIQQTEAKRDKDIDVDQKVVQGELYDEDEIVGALGMFDELDLGVEKTPTTDDNSAIESEECDLLQLQSSQPSIQKGWTGTTPKDQLEEWCRKHRIQRPTFSRLPSTRNGCKLKIKTNPELCLEEKGPFYDLDDAHQHLATQALFQMNPELPMYRIFPPVFRDLWKSWLDQGDKLKTIQKHERRNAKEERIQNLCDLIAKKLQFGDDKDDVGSKESPRSTSVQEFNPGESEGAATSMESQTSKARSRSRQNLMDEFSRRRETSAYKEMEEIRQKLPMYSYRDQLLQCIKDNAVTVLCAETGAGKTTQGPQFILEEALNTEMGADVNILCTQPRRISAISVADRVADEMCVKLGDLVGYQIRGESAKSQHTRLLFCTTGVVLRRLQEDPSLAGVTIVVVDEVHERSWQIDFLLVALRRLLQTSRPDLKVILVRNELLFLV
jgi:ATP-dependent RNA helicase DHX29